MLAWTDRTTLPGLGPDNNTDILRHFALKSTNGKAIPLTHMVEHGRVKVFLSTSRIFRITNRLKSSNSLVHRRLLEESAERSGASSLRLTRIAKQINEKKSRERYEGRFPFTHQNRKWIRAGAWHLVLLARVCG